MPDERLGEQLQNVRKMKALSLKSVSEPAGISPAYLQKLERNEVKGPSPHILHALAGVLGIPYSRLMELAGYVVPKSARSKAPAAGGGLLAHALSSENINDDEAEALARYLAWYRHDQGRPAVGREVKDAGRTRHRSADR